MPNLPTPGDPTTIGAWGDTLNTYLGVMHNADGTLKGSGGGLLVAATDATAAIKNRADYVCDGVADEVQINAAIAAAADLGSVVLSEGTFTVANPIAINAIDRFTLAGQGPSTNILPAASGFPASRSVIEVGQGDTVTAGYLEYVTVKHLWIDGGGRGTTVNGLKMACFSGNIIEVWATSCTGYGIWINSPNASNKTDMFIRGCKVGYNKLGGIFGDNTNSEDAHITQCIIWHSGKSGSTVINTDIPGILWKGASLQIEQVHLYGNTGPGFYAPTGLISRTKWSNCKIEMNGTSGSTLSGGIHATLGLNECLISGCGFRGNFQNHIFLGGSGKVVITGCVMGGDNNSGPTSSAAIAMNSANGNVVVGNHFGSSYVASPIVIFNPANGHVIRNNIGFVTNKSGRSTQSGTGAATAFTIAHGLSATPAMAHVTAGSAAARGDFSIATDATNITVTYAVAPTSGSNNVVLNWLAETA